ncbi:Misato segment II tubulin-like domain-containing protein [Irpex rosettiformis]|uniref:Misato segment II tubulin-like domain-containing protein n=1 Tax=Irpex rosettiformis TaxID=378272 RepID=A0ACB8TUP7_9APHY|nr:Misato segment II tubulin-like domain-containing protein [Irpex rosettiformis]
MKEIIYIQAGQFANHIGTHFWNAQQSYFTYGTDAEEPIVDHDVSFREGLNSSRESTFSPRLLLFDRKSNFGRVGDLYGPDVEEADEITESWEGDVVEYRQDPIPPSQFHKDLEEEEQKEGRDDGPHSTEKASTRREKIRYWSDYTMVYYHPRSLQRLPDLPDWDDSEGDWGSGEEMFERHDEDTDFMEGSFRTFVEECDHLQGIQITHDTATFGSFTNVLLTKLRDGFSKLPCVTFPCLSSSIPGKIDVDNIREIKLALNDALVLQGLCELDTTTVPLQSPATWTAGEWRKDMNLPTDDFYHTSAILSTHIESATLPFRLKKSTDDMSSLTSILNWRGNNRLAHLSGLLPARTNMLFEHDIEKRIYDFSKFPSDEERLYGARATYARVDVSRGFTEKTIKSYDEWANQFQPLPHSIHAPIIDLPPSFPPLFEPKTSSVAAISSIETTLLSSATFKAYGFLANECLTRHSDVVARMGVELEEIKELKESMWALEDAYKSDDDGVNSEDPGLGEDEEY